MLGIGLSVQDGAFAAWGFQTPKTRKEGFCQPYSVKSGFVSFHVIDLIPPICCPPRRVMKRRYLDRIDPGIQLDLKGFNRIFSGFNWI